MYQRVSRHDFKDQFRNLRPNNFSWEGLDALFDYLEDLEEDTGTPIELDVIALCCDFAEDEWEDLEGGPFETYDDAERYLEYRTTVVARIGDDRVLYAQY